MLDYLLDEKEEVINGVSKRSIIGTLTSKTQELIILPTEKCNFRCTYCYEDFLLGKMKPEVREGIKNLISERAEELENLSVDFFGGEPLLAVDVIQEILSHAKKESIENNFVLSSGMTTNGYLLTPELLSWLVQHNCQDFQITLDGDREAHNTTRLRADKEGTFDVIWENLLAARDVEGEFDIMLRLHLNNDNFDSLVSLCHKIKKELSPSRHFKTHFHDVRDLGGEGGSSVVAVNEDEYNSRIIKLNAILQGGDEMIVTAAPALGRGAESAMVDIANVIKQSKEGDQRNDSAAQETESNSSKGEPYICYASKPNSVLIRSDGRLGKCTVALTAETDSINTIGHIDKSGQLFIDSEKLAPWIRGLESLDLRDLGCPWGGMHKHLNNIKREDELDVVVI